MQHLPRLPPRELVILWPPKPSYDSFLLPSDREFLPLSYSISQGHNLVRQGRPRGHAIHLQTLSVLGSGSLLLVYIHALMGNKASFQNFFCRTPVKLVIRDIGRVGLGVYTMLHPKLRAGNDISVMLEGFLKRFTQFEDLGKVWYGMNTRGSDCSGGGGVR
ncbi:hypothetical protein HOY80DRAFT_737973 [Tuber brumale]|nr:hypothetical protein HOY80DRAFT_737973 [Tuber brumale]